MPVTLSFFGLCVIGEVDGTWGAMMPSVSAHSAILVLAAHECELRDSSTPDFIVHTPMGHQLVGWNLSTNAFGFVNGQGTPAWKEGERAKLIDLFTFHPGAKKKLPSVAAVIGLPGGELTAGSEVQTYDIWRGQQTIAERAPVRVSIDWTGDYQTLYCSSPKRQIVMKNAAVGMVTNAAPVLKGEMHFYHYYDEFFRDVPDEHDQITIHSVALVRGPDVYDCVPPIPAP